MTLLLKCWKCHLKKIIEGEIVVTYIAVDRPSEECEQI